MEAKKSGKMGISDSEHLRQRKGKGSQDLRGFWEHRQFLARVWSTSLGEQVLNTESICRGRGIGLEHEGERCARPTDGEL